MKIIFDVCVVKHVENGKAFRTFLRKVIDSIGYFLPIEGMAYIVKAKDTSFVLRIYDVKSDFESETLCSLTNVLERDGKSAIGFDADTALKMLIENGFNPTGMDIIKQPCKKPCSDNEDDGFEDDEE